MKDNLPPGALTAEQYEALPEAEKAGYREVWNFMFPTDNYWTEINHHEYHRYQSYNEWADHVKRLRPSIMVCRILLPITPATTEGETEQNLLDYVTGRKTLVDLPEDFAGDWFGKIHHQYTGDKTIQVEQFINSDARVSLLVVDNKIEAAVFERRTDFNNVEVFYCQKPTTPPQQVEGETIWQSEEFVKNAASNNLGNYSMYETGAWFGYQLAMEHCRKETEYQRHAATRSATEIAELKREIESLKQKIMLYENQR